MICKKCRQERRPDELYTVTVNGVEYLRTNKCRVCSQTRKPDPLTAAQKKFLRRTMRKFNKHLDLLILRQEEMIRGKKISDPG